MSEDEILNEEAFNYVLDNYDETLRGLVKKEDVNIEIQLPSEYVEKLRIVAEHQGSDVSSVVNLALRLYFRRFNDLFEDRGEEVTRMEPDVEYLNKLVSLTGERALLEAKLFNSSIVYMDEQKRVVKEFPDGRIEIIEETDQ